MIKSRRQAVLLGEQLVEDSPLEDFHLHLFLGHDRATGLLAAQEGDFTNQLSWLAVAGHHQAVVLVFPLHADGTTLQDKEVGLDGILVKEEVAALKRPPLNSDT